MPIIKDGKIVTDTWHHLTDDEPVSAAPCTVSLARWSREKHELAAHGGALGLRVGGGDRMEDFVGDLDQFPLIVVEFPSMTDGRGFSLARLLRERYGYQGELRARGAFILDQVFYLRRVGFDAFEFTHEVNLEAALPLLHEFSVTYQAAVDEPLPIYRRCAR
ncbi:DUF934 domain-containing protein [Methylococcus geothermalis]|uniref:DUF934 domain-containing protein n=1 Tax=Methylococcus geothermalis TaxID=2681310 RepID=A0A858Q7A5_9GAMM|nr:DUF934 domain-containing protein [Methylococcus geothermalis]QJD29710.1 DUF934 domain-containing protein [Methylococcus geothermalis]